MDPRIGKLFPRDWYGRIALALASLCLGPASWFMVVACLPGAGPVGVMRRVILAIVEELFLALALFFTFGLVWALATPHWMESFLYGVSKKLNIALALFAISLLALAAWTWFAG